MLGYRVPAPDEAMLVSGSKRSGGAPFEIVIGHGKFIGPMKRVRFLTLAMQEAEVMEPCVTKQGIGLQARAVIAFKVGADDDSITNAGQRFLSDSDAMPTLVGRIFAGHLRSIVGSMTVEEIVTERQKLATEVLDGSKVEMGKIGLVVDSFQIQQIDDRTGYVDQMSAPHRAAIAQRAKIAEAQANQAAVEAEQASQRQQIDYSRQTAVAQAEADQATQVAQASAKAEVATAQAAANRVAQTAQAVAKAEIDKANAAAGQAGPLSEARAKLDVTAAQSAVAAAEAELKQRQLLVEVVKPAEAEAQRVRVAAAAEAERQQILAAAAASSDEIALRQKLIESLPQIVGAAAGGLAGANITVLQGSEGVSEMLTGVVAQGLTIFDTLRESLAKSGSNGAAAAVAGMSPARP